jgi:endonuclease/exonuclease/phosphatase family metal-dependent hydrolase
MVSSTSPPFKGELSVLTYNIHGLPWPLAWNRDQSFEQMAQSLRRMRVQGREPAVVVLQEAFTDEARQIGRKAGYRHVIDGPSAAMANWAAPTRAQLSFATDATWRYGENMGKFLGSGLQILSDYPVVSVRRLAFPEFACAGYDCLANKGAVLVSIKLPDRADPVDIVTTHLNSRGASGVADARSDRAYDYQLRYLTDFIRRNHDTSHALIVAGDFNVGRVTVRRAGLRANVGSNWAPGEPLLDAYGTAAHSGIALSADAHESWHRAKDWQFFASGRDTDVALKSIDVPFGREPDGTMLSDHIGYAATFDLARRYGEVAHGGAV